MPELDHLARHFGIFLAGGTADDPSAEHAMLGHDLQQTPGAAAAAILPLIVVARVRLAVGKHHACLFRLMMHADDDRQPHAGGPLAGLLSATSFHMAFLNFSFEPGLAPAGNFAAARKLNVVVGRDAFQELLRVRSGVGRPGRPGLQAEDHESRRRCRFPGTGRRIRFSTHERARRAAPHRIGKCT